MVIRKPQPVTDAMNTLSTRASAIYRSGNFIATTKSWTIMTKLTPKNLQRTNLWQAYACKHTGRFYSRGCYLLSRHDSVYINRSSTFMPPSLISHLGSGLLVISIAIVCASTCRVRVHHGKDREDGLGLLEPQLE
jgi:hypothetical protein